MPRSRNTRFMERVSDSTPSTRARARFNRANGRGSNYHTYTSGARSADASMDNIASMRVAWDRAESNRNSQTGRFQRRGTEGRVNTYTSTRSGRMSTNGSTAGGSTNLFSQDTGSGRGGRMANRRVRYGEARASFNNTGIAVQRMGGTYEALRGRGLTDQEIRTIYGIGPAGSGVGGGGGGTARRGLTTG